MAELLARFDNLDTSAQSLWCYPVPEGRDVTIGRKAQTELEVPDWNRSDWVVEDPRISGRHVILTFDGTNLHVRRRLEPADRPAINPVFYKGKTSDDFTMPLGESFTVGSTTFTLQLRGASEAGDVTEPDPRTRTISREELRVSAFVDTKSPLIALAELPDIIRNTRDDIQLEERLLDIFLKGLPFAEFAGFVHIDPKGGPDARAAQMRSKQRGLTGDLFRVSNRLVRHAMHNVLESVLYIWDKKTEGSSNISMTMTPGTDWAICTPLEERPSQNRAIYIAGRINRTIANSDQLGRDAEFLDYQKFINLGAELFCTMRDMFRMEKQNNQIRRYLPRVMVNLLEKQNLEEKLKEREADVTALFCDLRGSSQHAQDATNLKEGWQRLRVALDLMTNQIYEKKGIIGGLQGDAAVGFWGWPDSTPEQIDLAVDAAQKIRDDFLRNNRLGQVLFGCGIGLAHGPAIVGGLGTYHSFKLDAYGTTMNLASRLESLTKVYGVQILVDGNVAARLDKIDPERRRGRLRSLAKVKPAGMTIRVPIFELMPTIEHSPPGEDMVNYNNWEAAMRLFVGGKWDLAQKKFAAFRQSLPDDREKVEKASEFFIDYIARRNNIPPEGWDGTIEMDAK